MKELIRIGSLIVNLRHLVCVEMKRGDDADAEARVMLTFATGRTTEYKGEDADLLIDCFSDLLPDSAEPYLVQAEQTGADSLAA